MTPGRWLTSGARVALFMFAVVGVAVLALVQRAWIGARVPLRAVSGRAAAAVGDSGVFASPVLPRDLRPTIPHANAESAAVAMGYREAPSIQDLTVPYYKELPLERRHFCGRSYYVRPVVAMPDTTLVESHTGNDWGMWAPTWVMPICDDAERVRTSVMFSDIPTGLRVVRSDGPGDVPELVSTPGTFPHIGNWPWRFSPDWERGIGMTPETAVAVAVSFLSGTRARVVEVPEAFSIVELIGGATNPLDPVRAVASLAICPRWRLALDRPVTLRGTSTGQTVHTRTVYVTRGQRGCEGVPVLEIPKPSQPATVPFTYHVRPGLPREFIVSPVNGQPARIPDPEQRRTTLRVVEPIWFEAARLVRERSPARSQLTVTTSDGSKPATCSSG